MIDGLKPYANRRDSGVPWIGSLPKHWQVFRAKVLFREVDERSVTGTEELLSVSHISGVRRRSELNANMFLAKSNKGHKLCRPNDLVINTMWAWMGALGISSHVGIVSPSYGVYRPHGNIEFLPEYVHHLLRTPAYVTEYTNRSTGIHSSRLRLYPDQFLRVPVILPPPDEQAAIVRFLDHANQRIERYIRGKRKLIALLNEQRQVATEAALRLPNAVSRRLDVITTRIERPVARQPQTLYTRVGLFNRGRGLFHKPATKGAELGDSDFFWIEESDVVLSGQFAWEGAVAVASQRDQGCIAPLPYLALPKRLGPARVPLCVLPDFARRVASRPPLPRGRGP